MAQSGLRLLSLDGGGTRGLTTLYTLCEVMNGVTPNNGGNIRPHEYFNLIGGSGLCGLCALLFVRFSYTIDQAIDFLSGLAEKLDDVEAFRLKVLQGDAEDQEDWLDCMGRHKDLVNQLAALRQGIVQEAWGEVIRHNLSDGLEQYQYVENGVFDYKMPLAETDPGRSKAFAVSSESQGYGEDGGFNDDRRYNVPLLQRTYKCRHGRTDYTMYAIGLATVASKDIMTPGVVFPDFVATGNHIAQNPVSLLLEECNALWPGLKIGTIFSIGGGSFEIDNVGAHSFLAANASKNITEDNGKLAERLTKFVLPFNKSLSLAYYRFDSQATTSFAEFAGRAYVQSMVKEHIESDKESTKRAIATTELTQHPFPTTPENQIAISSLAFLLQSLLVSGYASEAVMITDAISNFILYEAASDGDGSFRKVALAAESSKLGSRIQRTHEEYANESGKKAAELAQSTGERLLKVMAYGASDEEGMPSAGMPQSLFDYAAIAYYSLVSLRRGDEAAIADTRHAFAPRESAKLLDLPSSEAPSVDQLAYLLELITLAALCETGTTQALRGTESLTYFGPLIQHLHAVLLSTRLTGVSLSLLSPIANYLATCVRTKVWSSFRDDAIISLINAGNSRSAEAWSMANLAVERVSLEIMTPTRDIHPDIIQTCLACLQRHSQLWVERSAPTSTMCIENGWLGLLVRQLGNQELVSDFEINSGKRRLSLCAEADMHQTVTLGHSYTMKVILEISDIAFSQRLASLPNAHGQTPLHLACKHRAPKEIFRLLEVLRSDVNKQCDRGLTPLHYCFPDQNTLPSVYEPIMTMIHEYHLPTTIPLDKPQIFMNRLFKIIEPRVLSFRTIIEHLLSQQANISITDHEGLTSLHTAAKNGWGDNLDIFFQMTGPDVERSQTFCLEHRDKAGFTVLNHVRNVVAEEGMDRGEEKLVQEMEDRGMEIPAITNYDRWNMEPQWRKMKLTARPRTPVPNAPPGAYDIPQPPQSPQPDMALPTTFVYEDPDVLRRSPSSHQAPASPEYYRSYSIEDGLPEMNYVREDDLPKISYIHEDGLLEAGYSGSYHAPEGIPSGANHQGRYYAEDRDGGPNHDYDPNKYFNDDRDGAQSNDYRHNSYYTEDAGPSRPPPPAPSQYEASSSPQPGPTTFVYHDPDVPSAPISLQAQGSPRLKPSHSPAPRHSPQPSSHRQSNSPSESSTSLKPRPQIARIVGEPKRKSGFLKKFGMGK